MSVTPASGNGRSFVYDSLSRLQSAVNPESGTTTYLYDNASNLTQRTDGRGITSSLMYDALNRLTTRQYSDYNGPHPTPWVSYSYTNTTTDFVSQVSAGSNGYAYSNYDALGRPGAGTQTAASGSYPFTNLAWTPQGQLASIKYPSVRVVTTTFDGAGRPSGVVGSVGGTNRYYASGVTYAAHGGVAGLTGGDTLSRTIGYNARLQTANVSAGPLLSLGFIYSASGTQDNGNVTQQTIARSGFSATQTYGYDGANRLSTATETSGNSTDWSQTYVYDKAGNRAVTASSSIVVSNYTAQSSDGVTVPFDGNNHWMSAAGYDGAGNMTALRTQTMQYDAESRMYSWTDSSTGASVALGYDGDGRRVTKAASSGTTTYVYDPAGNLAAEYGGTATSGTLYLTQDHLGSTRLVTDASGNPVGCHDYLPFGEEVPGSWGTHPNCYNQTDTAVKFTGQERDAETAPGGGTGASGFDNFLARMFASGQGRFLGVDPGNAGADPSDPQSWNMYNYVGNNPLAFVDPSGMCDVLINGITQNPGDDSRVDAFGKNLINVFPFSGTNVVSGAADVALGTADSVAAGKAGLEAAIAQTPNGQKVNVTTISGGSSVLFDALLSLSPGQLSRIGNINYLIPAQGPVNWFGLPGSAGTTNYVAGTGLDRFLPSGRPLGNFNRVKSNCGHDPGCVLQEQSALLKSSQNGCPAPKVITQSTLIAGPPSQPQSPSAPNFSSWNPQWFDFQMLTLWWATHGIP